MALPSFVGAGKDVQLGGNKWVRLEEGKPVDIIPLTGVEPPDGETPNGSNCVISYRKYTMWLDDLKEGQRSPSFPAIGTPDDPGAMLGLEAKFTGLMICAIKGEDGEKIWNFGISVFKQLVDIEAALGESIKGHIIRVTKKGSGMSTKYAVVNTGRTAEIEGEPETDLMEQLGPTTRKEIVAVLEEAGVWPPVGGDPYAEAKAPPAKTGAKVGGSKPATKPATKPAAKDAKSADSADDGDWGGKEFETEAT